MISGVMEPALNVGDMDRSLAFYRDLLGFRVVEDKGDRSPMSPEEQTRWHAYHEKVCGIWGARIHVVFVEAPDGSKLELIEYTAPKAPRPPRRALSDPGVAMMAFSVHDSVNAVRRLRDAGVEVVADPVRYVLEGITSYTTYLYDPDGNAICLFEVVEGDR